MTNVLNTCPGLMINLNVIFYSGENNFFKYYYPVTGRSLFYNRAADNMQIVVNGVHFSSSLSNRYENKNYKVV